MNSMLMLVGKIALIVIAVLLLVILAILFIPIKYVFNLNYDDKELKIYFSFAMIKIDFRIEFCFPPRITSIVKIWGREISHDKKNVKKKSKKMEIKKFEFPKIKTLPAIIKNRIKDMLPTKYFYAISKIIREIRKAGLYVLPKNPKTSVAFGLEDPSLTGLIVAAIGPFFVKKYNGVKIKPYFNRIILKIKINAERYIQLINVVVPAIRIITDNNVRKAFFHK